MEMPPRQFSVRLPDWYYQKLTLWARYKGTAPATLAANIIQARIEANWPQIEADLEALAKEREISVEELKAEFLNGDD